MINEKIEGYLEDIGLLYSLTEQEIRALFLKSLAEVYNAHGSAYLWEDNTITVAIDDNRGGIRVKDYVISRDKYAKACTIFENRVREYSNKRDELGFARARLGKAMRVEIVKEYDDFYKLDVKLSYGGIKNTPCVISKTKLLRGDRFSKGEQFLALCIEVRSDVVVFERRNIKFYQYLFEEEFGKLRDELDEVYDFKRCRVFKKRGTVFFKVEYKVKPNGFFQKVLNERLSRKVGKCRVVI